MSLPGAEGLPADRAALLPVAAELLERWQLSVDGPLRHGWTSIALPVRTQDRRQAVLKVTRDDDECAGEIPALKAWGGRGAVELYRALPSRGASLLERLDDPMLRDEAPLVACRVVAGLLGDLHRPAIPQLRPVAHWLDPWLDRLAAVPADVAPPRLVRQAVDLGRELLATTTDPVILHGDLHPGNVLAAARRDWLAIDPKGWTGDPAYEIAPLLWHQWDGPPVAAQLRDRFWTLVDTAGLHERRARDWVVVRSMINIARLEGQVDHRWTTLMITTAKTIGSLEVNQAW